MTCWWIFGHCWHTIRKETRVTDRRRVKLKGSLKHGYEYFHWEGEIQKCHKCLRKRWKGSVDIIDGIVESFSFRRGQWRRRSEV